MHATNSERSPTGKPAHDWRSVLGVGHSASSSGTPDAAATAGDGSSSHRAGRGMRQRSSSCASGGSSGHNRLAPAFAGGSRGAGGDSSTGGSNSYTYNDDTKYWDWKLRPCTSRDLGHTCRECKRPFTELDASLAIRRGARIELKYHETCFSGAADPRTQHSSTANVGKHVVSLQGTVAPEVQYRKMRTSSHW